MENVHLHQSHPEIIKRLRRAYGHLNKSIAMIEDGRGCETLAQQLHAVEKAIANAKKMLIYDHINHCFDSSHQSSDKDIHEMIEGFKNICKFL